jgi:drug/metabolite transporter (DMT)-like permease
LNPPEKSSSTVKLFLSLLTIYIVWGTTFTGIKFGLQSFTPYFMAGVRFFISGLIFYAWARLKESKTSETFVLKNHWKTWIVGLAMTFSNALICWAEVGIDSGLAALLVTAVPTVMVLLNWFWFDKSRPKPLTIVGLAFSIVGLYVLCAPSLDLKTMSLKQVSMLAGIFLSTVIWAWASLWQKHFKPHERLPFFKNLAAQTLFGGFVLMVFSFLVESPFKNEMHISAISIGALTYLILAGTVLAYSCFIYALKHSSPAVMSTYALVNPMVALFVGVLFLGEKMTTELVLASSLILAGVALILFTGRPRSVRKN